MPTFTPPDSSVSSLEHQRDTARWWAIFAVFSLAAITLAFWAFKVGRLEPDQRQILRWALPIAAGIAAGAFTGAIFAKSSLVLPATVSASGGFAVWLLSVYVIFPYSGPDDFDLTIYIKDERGLIVNAPGSLTLQLSSLQRWSIVDGQCLPRGIPASWSGKSVKVSVDIPGYEPIDPDPAVVAIPRSQYDLKVKRIQPSLGNQGSSRTLVMLYSDGNMQDDRWRQLASAIERDRRFKLSVMEPGLNTGEHLNVMFVDDEVPIEEAKRILRLLSDIYRQIYFVGTTGAGRAISIGARVENHWGPGQRPLDPKDFESIMKIDSSVEFYRAIAAAAVPQKAQLDGNISGVPTFRPSTLGRIGKLVIEKIDGDAETILIKNSGSEAVNTEGITLASSPKSRTKPDWNHGMTLTHPDMPIEIKPGATVEIKLPAFRANHRDGVANYVFGLVDQRAERDRR